MSWSPKQCVVIPVDFSPSSAPGIQVALEIAKSADAVHAVHVIPALDPASPISIFGDENAEQQLCETAEKHLSQFLQDNNFQGVNAKVKIGEAAQEIVDYADSVNAGLIVIPSHGYHGVKRALLGSVAERVIRYANCETLVLRRPDAD